MYEQALDLRTVLSTLRRHRRALAVAALAGIVLGLVGLVVVPPKYTSTAWVLLPAATSTTSPTVHDVNTQIEIALSSSVLEPAGRTLSPMMAAQDLASHVSISSRSTDVIEVTGAASTPEQAQAIANAVAAADVAYLNAQAQTLSTAQQAAFTERENALKASLTSVQDQLKNTKARLAGESATSAAGQADQRTLGDLTAQEASLVLQLDTVQQQSTAALGPAGAGVTSASVIQQASIAHRSPLALVAALYAGAGLLLGWLIAVIVLVARDRRDRRLRTRDQIADAVGSPVVASLHAHRPRTVVDWSQLLGGYRPSESEEWAIRQALRQLTGNLVPAHAQLPHPDPDHGAASVLLVCFHDDPAALAVAGQLAAYAASTGTETQFVLAQRHDSAAALWTACSAVADGAALPNGLQAGTSLARTNPELLVMVAVLDREAPALKAVRRTTATALLVSPGTSVADELAHVAVLADDVGRRISGVVVADPDDLDRTTGRIFQYERAGQVDLPPRRSDDGRARHRRSRTDRRSTR